MRLQGLSPIVFERMVGEWESALMEKVGVPATQAAIERQTKIDTTLDRLLSPGLARLDSELAVDPEVLSDISFTRAMSRINEGEI